MNKSIDESIDRLDNTKVVNIYSRRVSVLSKFHVRAIVIVFIPFHLSINVIIKTMT